MTTAFAQILIGGAKAGVGRAAEPAVATTDPGELTPEQLAGRAQAGSREAFELLVARFERPIFSFLFRFARHRQDAEDLTQETFVRAWRSLPAYRPSLAFAPWLFTLARRAAASHFRSAARGAEMALDSEIVEETPANLLADKEARAGIWRLTESLKPKQAEALWLFYGQGFSIAETARVMGTPALHVRVLLHRGRANLAKIIQTAGPRDLRPDCRTNLPGEARPDEPTDRRRHL